MTLTVPELLRPLIRSPQRLAYHALFQAAAAALTRLAQDERFIETALPGGTGGLPTWGRPLQSHPPIHSSVPGGGLAKDHTTWGPSRAHFFGPVPALSPISRALFKEARRRAGVLEQSDPQGWTRPWHVQSQAPHHSHSAFTALAPSVFRGALANRRIVGLKDRTGTFTYRPVGRTRPPPAARCPTWGAPMRVVLRLWPSSRAFVETR
jgi:hypothetical protein